MSEKVAPDCDTACFLATARDDSTRAALADPSVFGALPQEAGAGVFLRVDTPLPKRKPDGSHLQTLPAPFDALILLRGPLAGCLDQLGAFLDNAGPLLDPEHSALFAGPEYIIKPADLPVLVVMLAVRKPDDDRTSFQHRWLHGHAPFGLRMPAPGYSQIHFQDIRPDAGLPPSLLTASGFDGLATVSYASRADVARLRATPEIALQATTDEMEFIDHARSMLMMFERPGTVSRATRI